MYISLHQHLHDLCINIYIYLHLCSLKISVLSDRTFWWIDLAIYLSKSLHQHLRISLHRHRMLACCVIITTSLIHHRIATSLDHIRGFCTTFRVIILSTLHHHDIIVAMQLHFTPSGFVILNAILFCNHYIIITSSLYHHYIIITSSLHHHYIIITSSLYHHYIIITSSFIRRYRIAIALCLHNQKFFPWKCLL